MGGDEEALLSPAKPGMSKKLAVGGAVLLMVGFVGGYVAHAGLGLATGRHIETDAQQMLQLSSKACKNDGDCVGQTGAQGAPSGATCGDDQCTCNEKGGNTCVWDNTQPINYRCDSDSQCQDGMYCATGGVNQCTPQDNSVGHGGQCSCCANGN